ncbi:MAG TPA: tryptophan synthase subunit alpha [Terriglobales bacterium]|nr:tryptophan synthase subunit alpha [Terriglobales bacterium]
MSRFASIFAAAKGQGRVALVPYITAGDPSLEATVAIALALAEAGADIVELGVPFSDPVADGPVIQAASERALGRGVRLEEVLEAAGRIRQQSEVGLLLFSYYNPLLQYGLERFAGAAAAAGCDGVLATDLIPEEASAYRAAARGAGLDTVFLAAPTSPDARLRAIGEASSGFVYAVSRLGVTGARATVADSAQELVGRLRRQTRLPIALGFGLSRREQVEAVAAYADGAVVGTALVERIAQAAPGGAAAAAGEFLRSLGHGHR